mgnify:CR=1 FL=1
MDAIHVDKIRPYLSGENLAYRSPLKKHTKYWDPESTYYRGTSKNSEGVYTPDDDDFIAYPWQKTIMFGVDITF